ncbi:MAG: NTE family protein RssA [Elusimicrobia bacterium ADurb.Bin231]|nr:MAG: NTE family protein RssA [Elusimicrobia bacterium ADurb.Bin231]
MNFENNMIDKKIGLALGGGAARGLAHIGVLKVLERYKIPINYIAGTSMGSIIGGCYAAGISADILEEHSVKLLKKSALQLFYPALSNSGFINGDNIKRYLSTITEDKEISKLNIYFKAVTTDFFTGKEYVIEKGSLFDALRASSAIPVVFTPYAQGERVLVDGGLSNPLPTSTVRNMGAEIVIAVNVVPSPEYKRIENKKKQVVKQFAQQIKKIPPLKKISRNLIKYNKRGKAQPNIIELSMQTRNIIEYSLIIKDIETNKPDFLIEPNKKDDIGWFEFNRAKEIIENGEKAAKPIIENLIKKFGK